MSGHALSVSDRAVRKANRERLLADMRRATWIVGTYQRALPYYRPGILKQALLWRATSQTSRTRYACLMTAFGF